MSNQEKKPITILSHHLKKPSIAEQIEIDLRQENFRQKEALMVIVLSPNIRAWLTENDPKALEQCRKALNLDKLCEALDRAALAQE